MSTSFCVLRAECRWREVTQPRGPNLLLHSDFLTWEIKFLPSRKPGSVLPQLSLHPPEGEGEGEGEAPPSPCTCASPISAPLPVLAPPPSVSQGAVGFSLRFPPELSSSSSRPLLAPPAAPSHYPPRPPLSIWPGLSAVSLSISSLLECLPSGSGTCVSCLPSASWLRRSLSSSDFPPPTGLSMAPLLGLGAWLSCLSKSPEPRMACSAGQLRCTPQHPCPSHSQLPTHQPLGVRQVSLMQQAPPNAGVSSPCTHPSCL